MAERTFCLGSREAYGSWKTICIFLRRGLSPLPFTREISSPSNSIEPPVGSVSLMMVLPKVVFPQPDSPTSPSVSPGATERETPSTALTLPIERLRKPPLLGNHFCRSTVVRMFEFTDRHQSP